MFPVSFERCAGWLHPAEGARGVMICGSIGFEDLCAHKSLAILADRIAAAGQPVLRFDYHGCGDSIGDENDPDRIAVWKQNIRAAIAYLKGRTGVTEIGLVGLRLGATLAAEVAADLGSVERIALLAPLATGKAYVRELKALSRVIGAAGEQPAPGEMIVAGFRLSPQTIADLSKLEPALVGESPARHVLAMGREPLAVHPVVTRLTALGCDVSTEIFECYDAMMCDPTASKVPDAALTRIANWIVDGAAREGARPVRSLPTGLAGENFVESPIRFGKNRELAGVYCRSGDGTPRQAVVILNAGAIHHVGWARGNVELARRLAASGVASLRIDMGGLGDSFAAPSGASGSPYAPELTADISAAIDWLETQCIRDVSVIGSCSGAYQAFHAAVADARVKRLALVNQVCFVWNATYQLQFSAWRATKSTVVSAALEDEIQATEDASRLFNKLMPVAKKFAKGSLNALMSLSQKATSGVGDTNMVEGWLETLASRGVKVSMIYSDHDPGLADLERWFGPEGIRATSLPGVEKHTLLDADHMLTSRRARQELGTLVFGLLGVEEKSDVAPVADVPRKESIAA